MPLLIIMAWNSYGYQADFVLLIMTIMATQLIVAGVVFLVLERVNRYRYKEREHETEREMKSGSRGSHEAASVPRKVEKEKE